MRIKPTFFTASALAIGFALAAGALAAESVPAGRQAKVEARISDMYATLHITQAQDAEWNAFAQVMLDNAQAMDAAVKQYGGDRDKLSAPEVIDNYAKIAAQHAQNVARLAAAVGMLYADLSPEQKTFADTMFRQRPTGKSASAKP